MNSMTIKEAVLLFGIGDEASFNEIRQRYHELIKEWHPDLSNHTPEQSHAMMIQLKEAFILLSNYCMNYQISFRSEDLFENKVSDSCKYWHERFGDDPIWG